MPWSVKGIDDDTRDEARRAAQAAGLTVGAWIERAIRRTVGQLPMTDDRTKPPNDGTPRGPLRSGGPTRLDPALLEALEQLAARVRSMETDVSGRLAPLADAIAALEQRLQADEAARQAAAMGNTAAASAPSPIPLRHATGHEPPDPHRGARQDARSQDALQDELRRREARRLAASPRRPAPPRHDGGIGIGRRRRRWPLAMAIALLVLIVGGGTLALYTGSGGDLERAGATLRGAALDTVAGVERTLGLDADETAGGDGREMAAAPAQPAAIDPIPRDSASAGPAAAGQPLETPPLETPPAGPPQIAIAEPPPALPTAPLPAPVGNEAAAGDDAEAIQETLPQEAADTPPAAVPREPIDADTALETVQARAEAGDGDAQVELGLRHAIGEGGAEQNYAEAARWFREAAQRNQVVAQYNLGVLYKRGLGVEQIPGEAIRWYRLAATQGHPGAQYNLGVAFAEGRGVEQDYAAAAVLFRDAADAGLPRAMYNLGLVYEYGLGVQTSPTEAIAWYRQAAEAGDTSAAERMTRLTAQQQAAAAPAPTGAALIEAIQTGLNALGYDAGPADGLTGPRTTGAIRAYQRDNGLGEDGRSSAALYSHIQGALAAR